MTTKFRKFYTDEKVVKAKYVDNPDKNLFSDGIYKTKLTEKDLPDNFIKWTNWYSRFIDMSGVVDVFYRPNPLIGNNTIKYDNFYISYDGDIVVSDNFDNDNWDFIISAVYGKDVIDKLRKYSPNLSDKLDEIEKVYNERLKEVEETKTKEMEDMGFKKSENGFGWEK